MRLIVLAGCLSIALLGVLLQRDNPLVLKAQTYARDVAAASAGVYITLRSLNAFLSTAQEVEVGGSLVVSGTAQPLKVLEPIDDTIERVADFVFLIMVATGVLAVALGPIGAVGFAMIVLALGLAMLPSGALQGTSLALARRLGWYGGFLSLGLPTAFVLTALSADVLTNEVWEQNTAVIAEITATFDTADSQSAQGDKWFSGLQTAWGEVDRYQDLAENIYTRADDLIASYVAILAVFVFKILLLPGLVLGGLFVTARFFAQREV